MNEDFELLDPESARAFLTSFNPIQRRRGELLSRKGHVRELATIESGTDYSAVVEDSGSEKVELHYDGDDGWSGSCSCPSDYKCAHMFAVMRALLAEHSTASVRNLSAGRSNTFVRVLEKAKEHPESSGLAGRVMVALGRQLHAEETRFIRKIQSVFTRCQQGRHITYWDFEEMGLPLGGYGFNSLQIWPSFPENEYDFWLYVANAAQEHSVAIPEFMGPITELETVHKRLARWKRAREIEQWKQTLGRLNLRPSSAQISNILDLRLVIGERAPIVECRRGSAGNFEVMKPLQLQQLMRDYDDGDMELTSEAALLWNILAKYLPYGSSLTYDHPYFPTLLRQILRLKALDDHLLTTEGRPLTRCAEPFRWELTPAANEDDQYRFRLVQADGSAPPPILCVMPGTPTLYLTAGAVFSGPPTHDEILDPEQESIIPAPAIETAAGISFLQSLGLPLPDRLRERVQTLPLQITIECHLQPIYPGSNTEDCVVNVSAEAADGHRQTWSGHQWVEQSSKREKRSRNHGTITIYDPALLATVPPLLAPLNLKTSQGSLVTRVSKKFPEVFSAWLKTVPPHITVHLGGELASLANSEVAGRVKLEVSEAEIDWFDLRVVLDVSDLTLTPEEIKLLLNAKGGYVRLAGKGWRRLQFDLDEEENERLARLGLSPHGLSAEPQRLHALQLADEAAKKFLPENQVAQIQRRASELKARVAPDLPAAVTAELRAYQLDGFHFLAYLTTNRFGGILADDMGLGKTLQALAWLVWLRELFPGQKVKPSLVVCPKSVMDNWQAEATRFTPGLKVKVWPAHELNGFTRRLDEANLHVLNYSQLRLLGEGLAPTRWQAVILDEGQYIKNPNSQTAQVARSLHTEQRLVLSGTPIENRLLDLWSLMAFAMPGILGSRAQFARLYDAKGDPFARRRLASRVRPFLLRRTKTQVAGDLPDRIEEDLYCEIEGQQQSLYRAELKRAQQMLLRIKTQKEFAQQQFHFLTSMLRLRQICCHPRLVGAESTVPSAKSEALLEQLEPLMEEGQKVLVFSQFVELLRLLQPLLAAQNWPTFYLAGETENRGELVEKFQSAEGAAVFLISLKAGGFGLNLTAASYVVLFDPWWNPAVENQAIDRTHRIGQINKVIAYRLLIKNSIEEKIRQLQKQKQLLAQDVLGEEKFAQSLTLQDLQFLFAD